MMGEQNEAPKSKGKWLATHVDTQFYGAKWNPPKGTEGAGGSVHQATSRRLSAVLADQAGPS